MVSTRHHPSDFPEPTTTSPTKSITSSRSTASPSPPSKPSSPTKSSLTSKRPFPSSTTTTGSAHSWSHTPSNLTLSWLLLSLPLVVWDTGYVLLRPHSMPGGSLHSPIWAPYGRYGEVDYIYGWRAYEAHNGFTAAQATLNVVETVMYTYYLWVVYQHGRSAGGVKGRGAPSVGAKGGVVGWIGEAKVVRGRSGGVASLVAFSAAVMTVSKTLLYWLNEYFSGFENIGHNSPFALLFLWIIPNGAWLVFPTYMIYVFGQEILQGLDAASGGSKEGKDQ